MRKRTLSEQTKQKISKALSGCNNPNYGKPLSPQHKNRIRQSMLRFWCQIK